MTDFDVLTEHSRWLFAFQADNARCQADLKAITPPVGQSWSDAQIQALIQKQQAWHDSMLAHYAPHAKRYEQQNVHGLAQALAAFLQDLREANNIFYQMLADRRRNQAQIQAYQQQTNTYIRDLQNQAFNEQKASWERQNARWSAAFNGHPQPGQFCSRCGSALHGHSGWNCPFCGASR